jgi:hypothetical protein
LIQARDTFNILITSADENPSADSDFLFFHVLVANLVKHMEGGACGLCSNRRLINPGSDRGKTFDMYAAGDSDIVCPPCIDVGASRHHAISREEYGSRYRGGDDVPQERYNLLDEWAQEQVEEVGYEILFLD